MTISPRREFEVFVKAMANVLKVLSTVGPQHTFNMIYVVLNMIRFKVIYPLICAQFGSLVIFHVIFV